MICAICVIFFKISVTTYLVSSPTFKVPLRRKNRLSNFKRNRTAFPDDPK